MTTSKQYMQALNNQNNKSMRVLGIDPGFARVGLAVVEKRPGKTEALLFSDCIETKAGEPLSERLHHISKESAAVIRKYSPHAVSIEKLFFGTNQKTAIQVAEARGVLIHEAASIGIPVYEYTPPQIKIAVTGYGRASKDQVARMVAQFIALGEKKMLDDEIDAIAIALTHCAHTKTIHTK